ncbi:hypothetical protein [Anaerospora hongkongensis]|uniref:hypothetical protein n=1 Tax=Anaerospora hongkongensis TaxID=244830 RepID=UPI002FD87D61
MKLAESPSALQVLLLEDAPATGDFIDSINDSTALAGLLSPAIGPLHRHLISLYLHNPYWNDFRILNHFHRRRIPLTRDDLCRLKAQCGLDNGEIICNTLIRLSVHGGLTLNSRQISFIEKNKPTFRDRDLLPCHPGELLVYECLFGRGVGSLGRVYIHFFVDLFTGYAFGGISQRRSLGTGLDILLNTVIPLYRSHNYLIHTVYHSSKIMHEIHDFNRLESEEAFSRVGLQWQPTRRKFGAIEKFEKSAAAAHFFETAAYAASLECIKPLFDQCLVKYNAANRLFSKQYLPEE